MGAINFNNFDENINESIVFVVKNYTLMEEIKDILENTLNRLDKYLKYNYNISLNSQVSYDTLYECCEENGYYENSRICFYSLYDDIEKNEFYEDFVIDEDEKISLEEFKDILEFCEEFLKYSLLKLGYEYNLKKLVGWGYSQSTEEIKKEDYKTLYKKEFDLI